MTGTRPKGETRMAGAFNETELLERVDHDVSFLAETVGMLAADGAQLMAEVRKAVADGDAPALARSAHALKGMISNFCAQQAHSSAHELEKLGKSGDLSAASGAVSRLESDVGALTTELSQFVKAKA